MLRPILVVLESKLNLKFVNFSIVSITLAAYFLPKIHKLKCYHMSFWCDPVTTIR